MLDQFETSRSRMHKPIAHLQTRSAVDESKSESNLQYGKTLFFIRLRSTPDPPMATVSLSTTLTAARHELGAFENEIDAPSTKSN